MNRSQRVRIYGSSLVLACLCAFAADPKLPVIGGQRAVASVNGERGSAPERGKASLCAGNPAEGPAAYLRQ